MSTETREQTLKLALPKGRIQPGVLAVLAEAGISVGSSERGYRPRVSLPGVDAKILKPQNVLEMLHFGTRDVGFAGADWVCELGADVVEVLDTELDPVRVVAAAPAELATPAGLESRRIVVASEYERIAQRWIDRRGLNATLVRTYGATEVFPPDDADCIVDVTASGDTLRANGLVIVDEILRSTTRLYASRTAWERPGTREAIERLALLVRSVIEARRRVMVELNVSAESIERVVAILPCMRQPTVSPLRDGTGFAVKVAAPKQSLPTLIPAIKAQGGTDIVVTQLAQLVE